MWIFARLVPPGAAIVTPRAPIDLASGGAVWFHHNDSDYQPDTASLDEAVSRLEHFLACLPRLYPIDPARIALIGFSQGAMVVNILVLTRPGRVIGVASLAGAAPALPLVSGGLGELPVFVAHGNRDHLAPVSAARRARETYTRLGADVAYGEYSVGHKMSSQAMKDLQAWLAGVIAGE